MKRFLNKNKRGLAFLIFSIFLLIPFQASAHDAYYIQVLIDDHRFQYIGNVLEDKASWYQSESKHMEKELGKFGGLPENVHPLKDDYEKYEKDKDLNDDIMIFTFQPKEISNWFGKAKNNATKKDVDKAYEITETLMPGLNDALKVANGGKPFDNVKDMMETANKLVTEKEVGGYKITKDGDKFIMTKGNEKYEFTYRMKKGYKNQKDFKDDTEYLTWNQLIYQANYAYKEKGYTLNNSEDLVKTSALEEMVVNMFQNAFNQLRNLLGLYEINDLVFNQGIRGSQAYTFGIMDKSWSDKAIAYHWLFQAFAWSLITFAVVKNLIQRNFATINPVMRISLIESIQNLMITGLLLANALPVINMLIFLNAKLVDVFGATAPNFSDLSGMNYYSSMLGGIIIQFFYLGVSIYLNFVYIMRAITIAILIATAPMFIVTIAFGGKWKELFGTWVRELVGNIFLQSFHAFMLSFFFTISTSSRGIEGIIICFALIPMTEFFRTLVMGQGGGISHSLGMKTMAQSASLIGGTVAMTTANRKGSSSSNREASSSTTSDSGMNQMAGNSEKIRTNTASMNQRQRLNATKGVLNNREIPAQYAPGGPKTYEQLKEEQRYASDGGLKTQPEGKLEELLTKAQGIKEGYDKAKEKLDNNPLVKAGKVGAGALKTAVGAGATAVGLGTAMAVGAENPRLTNTLLKGAQSGLDGMASGISELKDGMGSVIPESTQSYARTLPNGDMEIHRRAQELQKYGIVGASTEGTMENPIAKYTYDTSNQNMPEEDRNNIEGAFRAFASGDQALINHYKQHGIEGAYKQGNKYVIRYNQTGMDRLGIKSVQTIGASGSNPRIVETKSNYHPIETRVSLSVPDYQPPQTANPSSGSNNINTNQQSSK